MSEIRNVCVYCGSGPGTDPAFVEAARKLGASLAQNDIQLVYGGGAVGLMGEVARATLAGGGRVNGIIPEFLMSKEKAMTGAQDLVIVPDMHTRKQMMFERADAFVALPGGIGTLEELIEQLTWSQLGRHTKPILIADIGGFWKPLLSLLAHMRNSGFVRPGLEVHYLVAERIEDVVPMLRQAAKRARPGHDADLTAKF
jgi:uncharacterized protein (TIGR00730 family)